jgi:hypothetical protein
MNIYQRLNEVRKLVRYIKKDKEVAGKYWAVTHDMVTAEVREHLITHGIMIVPEIISSQVVLTGTTTKSGIPIIRYEARFNIEFVNCDEPAEKVRVVIDSHALDEGDKAPGKAISYATKYAMLKLFSIETGDDEESRYADAKVAKPQNKSVAREAFDALSEEDQTALRDAAMEPISMIHKNDVQGAYEAIVAIGLDNDDMVPFWSLFDSKERSALKKYKESLKETA